MCLYLAFWNHEISSRNDVTLYSYFTFAQVLEEKDRGFVPTFFKYLQF